MNPGESIAVSVSTMQMPTFNPTGSLSVFAIPDRALEAALTLAERNTARATRKAAQTGRYDDLAFARGCNDFETALINRMEANGQVMSPVYCGCSYDRMEAVEHLLDGTRAWASYLVMGRELRGSWVFASHERTIVFLANGALAQGNPIDPQPVPAGVLIDLWRWNPPTS